MAEAAVITLRPRRFVPVLCVYTYCKREGFATRAVSDSVVVQVASSHSIMRCWLAAAKAQQGARATGFELQWYLPQNGKPTF